jgi:hypothetical protein
MGNFVSEDQINLYKGFVKGIREDLGRSITLHIPGPRVDCPNCLFDPINKRSTGMFKPRNPYPANIPGPYQFIGGICPVCNGTGQYSTEVTKIIDKALIRWLKVDQKKYLIQGLEAENDFRIKCDIKYIDDFKTARVVEIDGVPAEVTTIVKRGLRDLIQIVVFLRLSEWPTGGKKDVSKY